jgi:hypothetical protein
MAESTRSSNAMGLRAETEGTDWAGLGGRAGGAAF